MKRFIRYILLFSSVLLVLGGTLEYMLRQVPNMFRFKKELMESRLEDMKTVIIGSSVVNFGLDPHYMGDSTYNLAVSGEWTRFNKIFLERYIDRMPHLKTVIWGQCYYSLWIDDTEEFSDKSVVDHKLYMGIRNDDGWKHNSELLSLRAVALRKWSKYYIRGKETMHCDSLGTDHSYDLEERNEDWIADIPELVRKQTGRMQNDKSGLYAQNLERIAEVAERCREKGIALIVVIPPVYKDFYRLADRTQMEMIDRGFGEIAGKYDNVRFLNYMGDPRFSEQDFYDGNHLASDTGAARFSRILYSDMRRCGAGRNSR